MASLVLRATKSAAVERLAVLGASMKLALFSGVIPTNAGITNMAGLRTVATEVANGNGYTTGGLEITNPDGVINTSNNSGEFTFDPVSWPSSTITATFAALYYNGVGPLSTDEIYALLDFGGTVSSTNGTFTCTPAANGVIVIF